jgi:glycosyltransferase involved in cell wall biosynthesis
MPDDAPWPRINIITPSYNQAQFIEETIRSVLLQWYPNLEYVVINGGSTDGSVGIIRRYQDRLTFRVSEPDRGLTGNQQRIATCERGNSSQAEFRRLVLSRCGTSGRRFLQIESARRRFDLNRQEDDYLAWYPELIDRNRSPEITVAALETGHV